MKEIILGDGGMGTELRFRGVEVPSHVDDIWSAGGQDQKAEFSYFSWIGMLFCSGIGGGLVYHYLCAP